MPFADRAIIHLDSIDSTNNYAATLIRLSRPPEGTVITAQEQTEGRGQRGSSWVSSRGDNLLCSIVLYPRILSATDTFLLSQCMSLALAEMITDRLGRDVWIKWPNDLIVNDKKIAGILIEFSWSESRVQSAICGIGLNLNQVTFPIPGATSVRLVSGQGWASDDCLQSMLGYIDRYYLRLLGGQFSEIQSEYQSRLYKHGEFASYLWNGQVTEAAIQSVDRQGKLHLHTRDGELLICDLKEISLIR